MAVRHSDPTGLHRVLDDAVVLPQAAERLDTRRELWPDEVRIRVAAAQPRRRVVPPARAHPHRRRRPGRHRRDPRRGPRHRRRARQDAEPRDRLRRHARRHRRGGRPGVAARPARRRPGRHAGLADAHPAGDRGRPGRLGRRGGAGALRRVRRAVRPLDRRRAARRPRPGAQPLGDGRLRRPGAHRAGRRRVRRPHGRGHRRRREVRLAEPGRRPGGRGRAHHRRRAARAARPSCSAPPAWPTRSSSPTRAHPVALRDAVTAAGGPADVTVVCVDVPGCEGGAILATAERGTVIFFSMATSFSAAALGAEGLAADVTMLVGNGYVPGHAAYALELLRAEPGVRRLFEGRLAARGAGMTRAPSTATATSRTAARTTRRPRSRSRATGSSSSGTEDRAEAWAAAPTAPWSTWTAPWSPPASSTATCTPSAPASRSPGSTSPARPACPHLLDAVAAHAAASPGERRPGRPGLGRDRLARARARPPAPSWSGPHPAAAAT